MWGASRFGHTTTARVLLVAGANPEAARRGVTPLAAACRHGHADVARLLLHHGARLPVPPPTLAAAARGHAEVLEMLLRARANVLQLGGRGQTALSLAVDNRHPEVARILWDAVWEQCTSGDSPPTLFYG